MTSRESQSLLLPSMQLAGGYVAARWVAMLLVVVLIALGLGLAFLPWQQSISGTGRVIALAPIERQQSISAPVDGRVLLWHVTEGSRVKAGDTIVEVTDNDPSVLDRLTSELAAAREREQSLAHRIAGLEASRENALQAAEARITMAAERVAASERGLEAAEATLLAARLNLERQTLLHAKGLTPTRSVELARMENDRGVAELERARNTLNAAHEDRRATVADRQRVAADYQASIDDARANRASAAASIAPIETRVARQSTQQVRVPRDGRILRLLAQPGSELLKAGEPIAVLVPDTRHTVVELLVHGNDMPLLHLGDKVRLQFEGWPAVQFVGWPSVAVGTFGGVVRLLDATDDGTGRFRVLVAPDEHDEPWPDARYLRQGVRANGWVLLRQVPLGFEVWRRFNGFPPTVSKGGNGSSPEPQE